MGVTCDFLSVITCTFPKRPSVQFTPKHGVLRTVKFGEWKVGDIFDSFAEFQQRIQALQDATAVQLYRREGKTLAASMQRYPGRDRTRAEPDKRNLSSDTICSTTVAVFCLGRFQRAGRPAAF